MNDVTIYVSRPTAARGLWCVRTTGRVQQEHADEAAAIAAAEAIGELLGTAAAEVGIEVESPDGVWNLYSR